MGLFSSETFESLDKLFLHQLKDLYDAEHRISDGLTKVIEKASSPHLANALQGHQAETKQHISRLEYIFEQLGVKVEREKCEAIIGVLKEAEEMVDANGLEEVIDAGLIAAIQRVEHYEIAGYGTTLTFARRLGHHEIAKLLVETLNEEKCADKRLTEIAESGINAAAQAA